MEPTTHDELEGLKTRMERFERTVATCLCVFPCLFALQCLSTALAIPVFAEMFSGFGAKLPALTEFVISARPLWLLIGISLPTTCIVLARSRSPGTAVVFSTIAGLVMMAIAQLVTIGMFLPIFQLGQFAGGL